MLTPEQIQFYKDNGYLLAGGVFTPKEIEECVHETDAMFDRVKQGGRRLEATWGGKWRGSPDSRRRTWQDIGTQYPQHAIPFRSFHQDDGQSEVSWNCRRFDWPQRATAPHKTARQAARKRFTFSDAPRLPLLPVQK